MIGLVFDDQNRTQLIHYLPEDVDNEFDLLVENLPEKDPTKSDMRADLHRDESNNLFWEYSVVKE
jgi:hypothetical protein